MATNCEFQTNDCTEGEYEELQRNKFSIYKNK